MNNKCDICKYAEGSNKCDSCREYNQFANRYEGFDLGTMISKLMELNEEKNKVLNTIADCLSVLAENIPIHDCNNYECVMCAAYSDDKGGIIVEFGEEGDCY